MRVPGPAWLALAGVLAPGPAAAHAAERGFVLLLPTGYYMAGGAAAVAVSFAVLALARRMPAGGVRRHLPLPHLAGALRWLGFAAFAALVAAGFAGPTDPLANPLPLTVWFVWWVGFTALTAIIGDLWPCLNPFSAPVRMARKLLGPPRFRLPPAAGYWPALVGLLAFAWFEIVSLAPADPRRLATAAAAYWLVQVAAMLLVGERRWRARGETFSVFFRLIGRIAAPHWTRRGMALGWPGARLARAPALPLSGWLFATSVIASVSFDGLSATFRWLALIGINPLAFPGRSAVVAENTAGLIAAWALAAALYAGAVAAGRALARHGAPDTAPVTGARAAGGGLASGTRDDRSLARTLGRVAFSLVPIALAYHLAHYLVALLVNGQYAAAAVAEALGIAHVHVTTSFLNHPDPVEAIWQAQTAIVVAGHVLAVAVAHAVALRIQRDPRRAALSELPLAALMVGLTVLALWLLSAPTGT